MASSKILISFSCDFRIQYHQRDKPVRDEIDRILKELAKIVQYIIKQELPIRKMRYILKIKQSNEALSVIILPIPRIIIKRIE